MADQDIGFHRALSVWRTERRRADASGQRMDHAQECATWRGESGATRLRNSKPDRVRRRCGCTLPKTKAAGARILEDLHDTPYGDLQYGVKDLDGHHWLFAKHARDVSPEEWGAKVSAGTSRLAQLRRPRFCYVEIPAVDLAQSVVFYEKVFGWNIRHRVRLARASMTRPGM
jgi:hypothetical protein